MFIKMYAGDLSDLPLIDDDSLKNQKLDLEMEDYSGQRYFVNETVENFILNRSMGLPVSPSEVLYSCIIKNSKGLFRYSAIRTGSGSGQKLSYTTPQFKVVVSGSWKFSGYTAGGSWVHNIYPLVYYMPTDRPVIRHSMKDFKIFTCEVYGVVPEGYTIDTCTGPWKYLDNHWERVES